MGKVMDFLCWLGLVEKEETVFYIGGSDVLPPPLKGQDEADALEKLEQGCGRLRRAPAHPPPL